MKQIVPVILLGGVTLLAASAMAQTSKKPVNVQVTKPTVTKPAAARKVAATARPAAKPHPTIRPRGPVFVPPPPVIELDEIAVVADLPTVLDNESRDRYRRI